MPANPQTPIPTAPATPQATSLTPVQRGAWFALGVVLSIFLPTMALAKVVEPLD